MKQIGLKYAIQLTRDDRARTWSGTWRIPAGRNEFKLVLNETWNNAVGNGGHGNAGEKFPPQPHAPNETNVWLFGRDWESISSEELAKEYRSEDDALVKTPYRHPGAGQNFYFVMTDRFANGNPENDRCIATGHAKGNEKLPVDSKTQIIRRIDQS